MSWSRTVLWSSLALALAGLPAAGQTTAPAAPAGPGTAPGTGAPSRIGNVYDGTAHQPTAGVQDAEKAAGVAPPPQAERREQDTISRIDKQLLGNKDNLSNPQAPRP